MGFESSVFRMWYQYEITYEDISGEIFTYYVYSEKPNDIVQVAAGLECNYTCKRIIAVRDMNTYKD